MNQLLLVLSIALFIIILLIIVYKMIKDNDKIKWDDVCEAKAESLGVHTGG